MRRKPKLHLKHTRQRLGWYSATACYRSVCATGRGPNYVVAEKNAIGNLGSKLKRSVRR